MVKERRINKPQHIKSLMQEQINALRSDKELDIIDRARAIGYLSNIALTSIKDGETDERLKEVEKKLEDRK